MSRKVIPSIVGLIVAAAILVGVRLLPKALNESAARQAAEDEAQRNLREAIRKAGSESGARVAKELAAQVASDVARKDDRGPAEAPGGAVPAVIDRRAYTITLPGDSTVDPDDRGQDKEHLATANFPGGGSLVIVTIDKKEDAGASFDRMAASLKGKLQDPVTASTGTFEPAKAVRSTAMIGTFQGERIAYEVAQCEGSVKACVLILEYPERKKAETLESARAALATFRIKG